MPVPPVSEDAGHQFLPIVSATSRKPSRTLGYFGAQPVASLNFLLETRVELQDVVRRAAHHQLAQPARELRGFGRCNASAKACA